MATSEEGKIPLIPIKEIDKVHVVSQEDSVFLIKLNPQSDLQFTVARQIDIDSEQDALHPDTLTHDAMSNARLSDWMIGDENHVNRYVAMVLDDNLGVMGITSLYLDNTTDPLYSHTLSGLRPLISDVDTMKIWGFNFWFYEDETPEETPLEAMISGTSMAIGELYNSVPTDERDNNLLVFLLDPCDETDIKVLQSIGFKKIGELPNIDSTADNPSDDIYVLRLSDYNPK